MVVGKDELLLCRTKGHERQTVADVRGKHGVEHVMASHDVDVFGSLVALLLPFVPWRELEFCGCRFASEVLRRSEMAWGSW